VLQERRRLVRRFLRLSGHERIECLIGDREFVGEKWFAWMQEERIPFLMRLRQNNYIANAGGLWSVEAIAPIKLKRHGPPEQSVFGRGLDLLAAWLHGIGTDLRRITRSVSTIFRKAAPART
jgi:hypothetical protein